MEKLLLCHWSSVRCAAGASGSSRIPGSRLVLFHASTAEESGLLGSEYYTDHPLFPLDAVLHELVALAGDGVAVAGAVAVLVSERGDQLSPLTLQYDPEGIDWPDTNSRFHRRAGCVGKLLFTLSPERAS